ncbi:putative RNA-binding protein 19 [Saguinus oedipus]|uniref:RNA-binding protein 19 n=1 Tax=Saguinus oedipus TaxID=9490 RepID=A0ABQ9UML9_SAGOE|nr:putative RNA-binding protein 19 [Saguinus oedipus]
MASSASLAQKALKHFNKRFIDTSRITVEFCKSFGDPTKRRACSKHARKPSQPKQPPKDSATPEIKKDEKKKKVAGQLEKLKEDAEFQEFLSVHQRRAQAATWANDGPDAGPSSRKSKPASDYLHFDSDSRQEGEEKGAGEDLEEEANLERKAAVQMELSDMDCLKSKMVKPGHPLPQRKRKVKMKPCTVIKAVSNEEEVKKAPKCNREYMGGRYIEVFRERNVPTTEGPPENSAKSWQGQMLGENEEEENLAESGRLFIWNLPYTSTEEDLEKLFAKYRPLSKLHYPIDSLTKKPKGFAFITFMFPEHSVEAYSEVDGQKKKEAQDKANSASSHNWNTLFMGPNVVADAIAQKYSATNSQVFDHETKGSVAVRGALGETQLVQEVQRFLIDNGVSLDSFSQAAAERSKTAILVKNLREGTLVAELQETFGHFGSLGCVLLPEGGITTIVEFLEPLEARKAFRHLA